MTAVVAGELAGHPQASAFAEVVESVHHRYALEVVAGFRLCPFLGDPTPKRSGQTARGPKDPSAAFGSFCVVLDREPVVETACRLVVEATSQVVHLVYPLVHLDCSSFERFGGELHKAVALAHPERPVHATFHPDMEGDRSSASRIIGLLRRSPDPFVQFVPEGLHIGGTTYLDPSRIELSLLALGRDENEPSLFERLTDDDYDRIRRTQDAIKEERARRYQPFLEALSA
ncbi:MAG: hypothetical protein KC731_19865 [Myxococcales bacterium]|nr:hypothetical protein [Myxococcales bacterium]